MLEGILFEAVTGWLIPLTVTVRRSTVNNQPD